MSFLLDEGQFVRAREALDAGDITDDLYGWLGRLVAAAQATRSLAPAPVPSGRWDDPDAVSEALHAWLEESLLRGALRQAFDRCSSPRSLSRYLERTLRNWLVGRSRRRTGPRLLERADELLRSDAETFRLLRDGAGPAERWWTLAGAHSGAYEGTDSALISAAWALGDFALLRYPSSERSDPVLSTPDLERFVRGLLTETNFALSGRHIDIALRGRFPYAYAVATATLDEALELSDELSPAALVEIEDSARIALANMTGRQLQILLERPEGTLEELAGRLGTSKSTVDNEYRRAMLKVREASPSDSAFDAVLENVQVMASEEDRGDE